MAAAVNSSGHKPLTSIQANILDLVTDTVRLVQKYMEETPPEHWAIPLEAGVEAICLSEHFIQWRSPHFKEACLHLAEDSVQNSAKIEELADGIVNSFSKTELLYHLARTAYRQENLESTKSFLEKTKASLINLGKDLLREKEANSPTNDSNFCEAMQAYAYLEEFDKVKEMEAKIYSPSSQSHFLGEAVLNFIANRSSGVIEKNLQRAEIIISMVRRCYYRSDLLKQMAHVHKEDDRVEDMQRMLQASEDEADAETYMNYKAKALLNLALANIEFNNIGLAKTVLIKAKSAANKIISDRSKVATLIEIALLYNRFNENEKLQEMIQEIRDVIVKIDPVEERYHNLSKLVAFYLEMGDLDNAERCAHECIPHMKKTTILDIFKGIFMAYIDRDDRNNAGRVLSDLEALRGQMTEHESIDYFYKQIIYFYCKLGDIPSARRIAVERFPQEKDSKFIKIEIESGRISSAEEMVGRVSENKDYMLKDIALAYVRAQDILSAIRVANRISNYLKSSVLQKVFWAAIKHGNKEEAFMAAQDLDSMAGRNDDHLKELCSCFMELDELDKAERIAYAISDDEIKSSYLVKIISIYIKNQNLSKALEMTKTIPDAMKQCEAFYHIINFIDSFSLKVDKAIEANKIVDERTRLAMLMRQIQEMNIFMKG